jgi:hypothetical protein
MMSHQLQQMQQLAASHPGLVQVANVPVPQQVVQQQQQQQQHAVSHVTAADSDDSSVDEVSHVSFECFALSIRWID